MNTLHKSWDIEREKNPTRNEQVYYLFFSRPTGLLLTYIDKCFLTWSRIRADSMRRGQTDFRIKRTSINESPGSTYLAKTYRGQWLKMLESSIFRRINWSWNNILCPLILWQVYKFAILCLFLKIILVEMCLWTKAYTWQERSHITWCSMILLCRFWVGHLAWKEPHDESRYYDNYTAKSISHDVQKDP